MQRMVASNAGSLEWHTLLEKITGEMPEILEYLDFGFWDWCWYMDQPSLDTPKLGQWLGVSHKIGTIKSYWILTEWGKVISRTTVQHMTTLELKEEANRKQEDAFNTLIKDIIWDTAHVIIDGARNQPQDWTAYLLEDDIDFHDEFNNVVSNGEVAEADQPFTPDVYNEMYLRMELALPQGDSLEPRMAKVTKRMRDVNSILIGVANQNPILDTRMYKVEFLNGEKLALLANYIAETLFMQVDDDGN